MPAIPTQRETRQSCATQSSLARVPRGIAKTLAKQALEIAREKGALTVFSLVDPFARLSGKLAHIGDRAEADEKAGPLLALAA